MIYGPLHAVGCSLCNSVVSHFVYWGSDSPWYDCHGHWWESKMICEESWIRNPFLHLRLLFPISDILCAWSKICMMALSLPRNFDRTCDIDVICVLWRYGCTCICLDAPVLSTLPLILIIFVLVFDVLWFSNMLCPHCALPETDQLWPCEMSLLICPLGCDMFPTVILNASLVAALRHFSNLVCCILFLQIDALAFSVWSMHHCLVVGINAFG